MKTLLFALTLIFSGSDAYSQQTHTPYYRCESEKTGRIYMVYPNIVRLDPWADGQYGDILVTDQQKAQGPSARLKVIKPWNSSGIIFVSLGGEITSGETPYPEFDDEDLASLQGFGENITLDYFPKADSDVPCLLVSQ